MDEPYTFPWEDPFKTQSVLEQRNKSTISCNSYDLIEDDDIPIQMSPKRRSIDIVFSILSRSISPSSPPPPPTTTTLHQDSSIDNFDFLPPPSHPFSRSSSNTSASSSNPYLPSSPPRTPNKLSKRDRYFSSLTSRNRKKLIISGITATQVKKFEGVKRWCEVRSSFLFFFYFISFHPIEFW